jgi:hypothetical protein
MIWVLLIASLLPTIAIGQEKERKLDPCTLLTAVDAASIMGAPISLVKRDKSTRAFGFERKYCLYGVPRNGAFNPEVSLGVSTYENAEAEDKGWASITKTFLDPSAKDKTQVLSGIGDEAYLTGYAKDGKMTAPVSMLCVRKGAMTFTLTLIEATQASSADASMSVAKRIADQL